MAGSRGVVKKRGKAGIKNQNGLSVCFVGLKRILYYELLSCGRTDDYSIYFSQLDRLEHAFDQKRPESAKKKVAVLNQDNTGSRTLLMTFQKLWELRW